MLIFCLGRDNEENSHSQYMNGNIQRVSLIQKLLVSSAANYYGKMSTEIFQSVIKIKEGVSKVEERKDCND